MFSKLLLELLQKIITQGMLYDALNPDMNSTAAVITPNVLLFQFLKSNNNDFTFADLQLVTDCW